MAKKPKAISAGWPADAIEQRPIKALIAYAKNSRTHDKQQVAQIAASIKEWGWTNPVLIDEQNNIIAGHGRVMAAQVLAIETIPCVVAKGWTKQQRQAYVIADNKLALNAGWDDDMLKSEFEELQAGGFDLDLIGFTDEEMQSILQEVDFSPSDEDDQGRLDEVAPKLVTCPHCSHVFDMRKADED